MSHKAPRYYLIKQSELNRLTYNSIQTERYGICKVVRRETACGIRSYNLTHDPEHDNQMCEKGAKAERERVLKEAWDKFYKAFGFPMPPGNPEGSFIPTLEPSEVSDILGSLRHGQMQEPSCKGCHNNADCDEEYHPVHSQNQENKP